MRATGPNLGWILLLACLHGLVWVAVVPPWQAPDEPKHFEYVRLLAEGKRLVVFAEESEAGDPALQQAILADMDRHRFWWYAPAPGYDPDQPPTRFAEVWPLGTHTAFYRSSPAYYWLASRLQPADRWLGLYAARLFGVLLATLTVLFVGLAARELFPDEPLVRYGAPLFAALHPMAGFLQAGVNNDALVHPVAAFVFLLMARMLARGPSVARVLLVLASLVGAVLVKRTALLLVPAALLALLLAVAIRRTRPSRAIALGVVALLGGCGLLGLAWQVDWAARLPEAWRFTALRYLMNEPDQARRILDYLMAPAAIPIFASYLWRMHSGFWGSFGWEVLAFPAWVYAGWGLVAAVAAAGALRRILDRAAAAPARAGLAVGLVAVGCVAFGTAAFFLSYLYLPYPPLPQGRYLFVVLGPSAVLLTAGLGAWVPPGRRAAALKGWAGLVMAFDLAALLTLVLPYFYR